MYRSFIILLLLGCWSCQTDSPSVIRPKSSDSTTNESNNKIPPAQSRQISTKPTCILKGNILSHNQVWIAPQNVIVCIAADSSTYDDQFGESHRKLSIYNASNCTLSFEWTLPVNTSPDFPYYLADLNYNKNSHLIAIKGHRTIHCLDSKKNQILPPVTPTFTSTRVAQDAQSGAIIRLELWEDYIVGFAQDFGSFVFLINENSLTPLAPYAEYRLSESQYNSLFLISSKDNKVQAIAPNYDWEEEVFSINPIFSEPLILQKNIIKSALNNRYIVLKSDLPKNSVAIDLKDRKVVELPTSIQGMTTKEIITWMRKQGMEKK